jgi:segregation and condensation protein B
MPELIDQGKLKQILEAALMAADEPLTVDHLTRLFSHGELDSEEGRTQIRDTLAVLEAEAEGRGFELVRVASGYRYQVRQELSEWVSRLWDEKPPRYTRALLETLALIAYRQPVTRGDIEEVRGVAVSQNIMRTLVERGWIRVVGQREVPGRPSLYGTTRAFLDYFALKSLDQLPPLAEIRSLLEPLVIEEVVQEARVVVERDHPELTAVDGGDEPMEAATTYDDERQNHQETGREQVVRAEDTMGVGEDAEDVGEDAEDVGEDAEVGESVEWPEDTGTHGEREDFEDDAADVPWEHDDSPGEAGKVVKLPLPPRR